MAKIVESDSLADGRSSQGDVVVAAALAVPDEGVRGDWSDVAGTGRVEAERVG